MTQNVAMKGGALRVAGNVTTIPGAGPGSSAVVDDFPIPEGLGARQQLHYITMFVIEEKKHPSLSAEMVGALALQALHKQNEGIQPS